MTGLGRGRADRCRAPHVAEPAEVPARAHLYCAMPDSVEGRARQRVLRLLAALLLAVGPGAHAVAARVVHAPHVDVLYEDPALAPYAQTVAAAAERELLRVAALFGRAPFPIRIRLQGGDDVFNAFALPLPRPHVTFRPLFPLDGTVGFHGPDLTELVLRHEITHLVQLTDTRVPPGSAALPHVGLVGQGTAVLPPAWLLEGIATWVESTGGLGGRLDDARTHALLWTLAAQGSFPTLADVSLISYRRWPGGRARYLLGASFIDHLVKAHGFDALVRALHVFQAGAYLLPFDAAWKRAVGTDLEAEWTSWSTGLATQARERGSLSVPGGLEPSASTLGAPALAGDGRTLAWPVAGGVRLATWQEGALAGARTLPTRPAATGLTWLDDHTLVMAAVGRAPGSYDSDLFALDVRSGAVRRLTHGAHAHLPRADGAGCVLYVRDTVPGGASLRRWCAHSSERTVWEAPPGAHVVGLAVSAGGRVALSLYRSGGVDLALLGKDGLTFLTSDGASELAPRWVGEDTLLYTSDASGLFQLHRSIVEGGITAGGPPLTHALGGAEEPVAVPGGALYRTVRGDGFALAFVPLEAGGAAVAEGGSAGPDAAAAAPLPGGAEFPGARTPAPARTSAGTQVSGGAPGTAAAPYPDTPYSPWPSLLPYGWWPSAARLSLRPLGAGLEITALGLDDSARHALDLTVGYDTALRGPLAGGYGSVRYAWNMPNPVAAPGPPPPLGVAVRLGAWPHGAYLGPVDETAYGVQAMALLRGPMDRFAGSLTVSGSFIGAPSLAGWRPEAGIDAFADARAVDAFGAVSGGELFAVHARWSYGAAGPSAGAWAEARWWPSVVPMVHPQLALTAGYRPLPPVPVVLPELAAIASLGARLSVPVRWRWADGLAALERIDVQPAVRLWGGTGPAAGQGGAWASRVGVGGDVGLWADTVLDYEGVVRLGVRGGYADGWWLRFGLGLPF